MDAAAVAQRAAAYDPDGSFHAARLALWRSDGDTIQAMAAGFRRSFAQAATSSDTGLTDDAAHVTAGREAELERRFSDPIDARWIAGIACRGSEIHHHGLPLPDAIMAMEKFMGALCEALIARHPGDAAFETRCRATLFKLVCIQIEIMTSQIAEIRRLEAIRGRAADGGEFRAAVGSILDDALRSSAALCEQTGDASTSTRGMLGKASEVAAAAEQSAAAMRDAARTAAGLIRAIDEARSEVETAAAIATRAASQSAAAVTVSEALSDHALAIESILGLIRDIAGQTNLLALNATIEAARAGDSGRGFAVVAAEVKNLAAQTARATDDIAAKIAAIQAATRQTVDANGSIRDTVGEVQSSALRIRGAMETQARTVTMITAAVDETALAADSMSATIAAIRTDTEAVAGEIDLLEGGFRAINERLSTLGTTTGDFVTRIAA